MSFDDFKGWCVRHRTLLLALGIVVVVTAGSIYLMPVRGGVYIIMKNRYPFAVRYVGQTKNFTARMCNPILSGYYDPARHWFVKIPLPSAKDALEETLIKVLKPALNRSYTVAVNAGQGVVSWSVALISPSAFVVFWRNGYFKDRGKPSA
jgi:hypothetical protein